MTNSVSYPPGLDSILSLLRSNQDERKLAGLLLVTRVVVGHEWPVEVLSLLYDAVGSTFLRRLLRSTDNEGAYVDLAINVIAAFAASPDVAKALAKEGLCADIVSTHKGSLSAELLDIYTSFINAGDPTPLSLMKSLWQNDAERGQLKSIVNSWIRPEFAQQILFDSRISIMPVLAEDLKSRQDLQKFEALEMIVTILSQLHPFSCVPMESYDVSLGSWGTPIRDGLTHILSSRVNAEQRRLALFTSWFLLDLFGYSWASAGSPINDRFPTLLITTVAIESRVLLEYYAEHPAIDEGIDTLRTCFIIAQMSISFLIDEDDVFDSWKRQGDYHWSLLPPESLMLIQSRLSETIRSIFDFIVECESQERYQDPINPHLFRLLGAWIGEDSESFQSNLETSCSFLNKVCQESADPFIPFVYLLSGFSRLSLDLAGAERLVECGFLDLSLRLIPILAERGSDESNSLIAGDICHVLINLTECMPSITSDPSLQKMLQYFPTLFNHLWASPGSAVACLQIVCMLFAVGRDCLTPSLIDRDAADLWPKVTSLLFEDLADDDDVQDLRLVAARHLTSCIPHFKNLSDILKRCSLSLPQSIQRIL